VAIVHPRGTIILASQVPDQNGMNPKDRPELLLVDFHDTHDVPLPLPFRQQHQTCG